MGVALTATVTSVLMLLPQFAIVQKSTKPTAGSSESPRITWHPAGELTVPFEVYKNHIYITLSLNGKPGFAFMLDSGANRNILNLQTARRLGIKPRRLQQQMSVGFGNGLIYSAPEQDVNASIDSIQVANEMSILDLNRFQRHFEHPTDGMLGYPFFQHFVVKLDFERKLVSIFPPGEFSYGGAGVRIPLKASKDFVVMPIVVGTDAYYFSKVDMVVDSGSNLVMMLYRNYAPELHLDSSLIHAMPSKGYGLNGPYPMEMGTIDVLRIGYAEARNVSVAYLSKDDAIGPARHIHGAVGNGILQSFQTVIFDVPHRRMIFELRPAPWQSGVARTYIAPR